MAKIYKRHCNYCKKYYEGYGAKFCPGNCSNRSRKKLSEDKPSKEKLSEGVQVEYSNNSAHVDVRSLTVNTLEGALEISKVDLDRWAVTRHKINSWQVTISAKNSGTGEIEHRTNWQVIVWLDPKVTPAAETGFLHLIDRMPLTTLKFPKFKRSSNYAAEMDLIDVHFAKLAWGAETGRPDYDLDLAVADYILACGENLEDLAPYSPEIIYFIVGQDLMHIENFMGITPKGGNILDVDSRFPRLYEKAMETVIRSLYMCREVAPVEVLWIPGNHDMHASMHLCFALREHFRKDKQVTVDVSPPQRKARLFGNLLVGWTHEISSKEISWANELAQAYPQLWGQSVFREWHYGHKHKRKETKTTPVTTEGGVLLRQLSSLSQIDAWHFENKFTDAVPGAQSLLWTKDRGVRADFMSLVRRT